MGWAKLKRGDLFPTGTLVSAYHRRAGVGREGYPPPGEPDATATVAADGSVAFTGLEEAGKVGTVPYVAYAVVAGEHRKLQFSARRGSGPTSPSY